jgi:hypothetical protein
MTAPSGKLKIVTIGDSTGRFRDVLGVLRPGTF